MMDVKSFKTLTPGVNAIKLFLSVSYQFLTKLECLLDRVGNGTNTLILFRKFVNYGQKSFITLAPGEPAGRKPYNWSRIWLRSAGGGSRLVGPSRCRSGISVRPPPWARSCTPTTVVTALHFSCKETALLHYTRLERLVSDTGERNI